RVSAVFGTHTHVQTADAHILPGGTAYITDAGMTGGFDSVIGMDAQAALRRFLTLMPERLTPSERDVRLNGVRVAIDAATGRATTIEPLQLRFGDAAPTGGARLLRGDEAA